MNRKDTKEELKRLMTFYSGSPPPNVIKEQLGLTEEEAKELMGADVVPKVKRAYKKKIAIPKRAIGKKRERVEKIVPPEKSVGKKISDVFHNIPIGIIRIMASVVALIALIRSGGYVYSHFARIDTPFFAILMAGMIVMVSFVSPQILVYSYRKRNWFVMALASLILMVFAWFNVYVTVQGLAYAREQVDYYVSSGQENIVKAKRRLIELEKKEEITLQDRERDGIERDTLQAQFEALASEIGSDLYITTRSRLNASKERYDKHRASLDAIDKERRELNQIEGLDSVRIKEDSTKEQEAEMDKIIAIGLELAGPIMLAFALFL